MANIFERSNKAATDQNHPAMSTKGAAIQYAKVCSCAIWFASVYLQPCRHPQSQWLCLPWWEWHPCPHSTSHNRWPFPHWTSWPLTCLQGTPLWLQGSKWTLQPSVRCIRAVTALQPWVHPWSTENKADIMMFPAHFTRSATTLYSWQVGGAPIAMNSVKVHNLTSCIILDC